MLDGESHPKDLVRYHLQIAREIAKSGRNPVLAYILEMAIEELASRGLEGAPDQRKPNIGVA